MLQLWILGIGDSHCEARSKPCYLQDHHRLPQRLSDSTTLIVRDYCQHGHGGYSTVLALGCGTLRTVRAAIPPANALALDESRCASFANEVIYLQDVLNGDLPDTMTRRGDGSIVPADSELPVLVYAYDMVLK